MKKFEINLIESGSNFFRIVSTKGSEDSKLESYQIFNFKFWSEFYSISGQGFYVLPAEKTENQRFSGNVRGYKMGTLAREWVKL